MDGPVCGDCGYLIDAEGCACTDEDGNVLPADRFRRFRFWARYHPIRHSIGRFFFAVGYRIMHGVSINRQR